VGLHINTAQAWEKGAQARPKHLPTLAGVLAMDPALLLDQIVELSRAAQQS
jgi:hypothetical protein